MHIQVQFAQSSHAPLLPHNDVLAETLGARLGCTTGSRAVGLYRTTDASPYISPSRWRITAKLRHWTEGGAGGASADTSERYSSTVPSSAEEASSVPVTLKSTRHTVTPPPPPAPPPCCFSVCMCVHSAGPGPCP